MVLPNEAKISHSRTLSNSNDDNGRLESPEFDKEDKERDTYLGVDFGKAHLGLAIAESESKIAFRYGAIPNNKEMLVKLAEIVEKEGISKVIIGIPSLRNWGDQGDKGGYKGFMERLQEILPEVAIEFQDEMFTTKMAKDNLLERGGRAVTDHEEAARIILQSWLESRSVKRRA